jgi:phenylacetate-CoA ligase
MDRPMTPFLRRQFIEPLAFWRNGSPRLHYWKHLENTQYLPEEKLLSIQWSRMNDLLRTVYNTNSFYRRRFQAVGATPDDIRSTSDLKILPILRKNELRENLPEMISEGYHLDRLKKVKTGGSTGKPLDLLITEECSELRNACARRHDRWSGWEVGEPIGALWGNVHRPKGLRETLKWYFLNPYIFLDTMHMDGEAVKRFAKEWRKVRPTLLFGHAHSIYLLSRFVEELSVDEIRPRGIISTSMMLLSHERRQIEKTFGNIVFDRYGCEELGLVGSECEAHDGMHMNVEHLFVEFVDGDTTDGDGGRKSLPKEIVVTDLMNFAMPLIRYAVEDKGICRNRICRCGRGLPLMDGVTGRVADFLIRQDGTKVAGISLIENTLTKFSGLNQMQIVQDKMDRFRINIVAGPEYHEETGKAIIHYFKAVFGNVNVNIEFLQNIPQERNGKYRFSICNVQQ